MESIKIPDKELEKTVNWCEDRMFVRRDTPILLAEYSKKRMIEFVKWLTKGDAKYAIFYGAKKHRFTDGKKDYTIEDMYEIFCNQ